MTDTTKLIPEAGAQHTNVEKQSKTIKSDDFVLHPIPMQSSTIAYMGHKGNQMRVMFHSGEVYEYGNISKELFDSIFNNKVSVGKAFNAVRKDKHLYPFRKI